MTVMVTKLTAEIKVCQMSVPTRSCLNPLLLFSSHGWLSDPHPILYFNQFWQLFVVLRTHHPLLCGRTSLYAGHVGGEEVLLRGHGTR